MTVSLPKGHTPTSGIPAPSVGSWQKMPLGNILAERKEKVSPKRGDDRPYVALEHMPSRGTKLIGHGEAGSAVSDKTAFRQGDVLFGKLRPNLRKCLRAPFDGICSTDILALYPRAMVDADYAAHLLRSEQVMQYAENTAIGTKMPRTSWTHLAALEILLPPLPEQRRIAEILTGVDDAIDATRAVIDQTRKLKTALLQDLLSNGLPGRHTQFKTVRLGDVFTERKEKGLPGLPVASITMHDGLVPRDSLDRRVESALKPEEHSLVRQGDIAYNMMRMWQGVFGLAEYDCLISPAYVVVTPTTELDPRYAAHLFSHPHTIHLFHLYSQGVVDDRLRLYFDQFASIPLGVVAHLTEQRKIAEILDGLDQAIGHQQSELEQFTKMKSALGKALFSILEQLL